MGVLTVDTDLADLAQDHDLLTMGITPSGSGDLHGGHYTTLFNLGRAIQRTQGARGLIYIDDREYHSQKKPVLAAEPIIQRVEGHLAYFFNLLDEFLEADQLKSRIAIRRVSACFQDPGLQRSTWGSDFFDCAAGQPDLLKKHYRGIAHLLEHPTIALCTSCGSGSLKVQANTIDLPKGVILGTCEGEDCPAQGETVEACPEKGDTNWSVFYVLMGVRDALLAQTEGVLHVYGGDYNQGWGKELIPKSVRMHGLVQDLLERRGAQGKVNHYVGPLLTRQGRKLAKSRGDSIEDTEIRCDLLARIIDSHAAKVDYR